MPYLRSVLTVIVLLFISIAATKCGAGETEFLTGDRGVFQIVHAGESYFINPVFTVLDQKSRLVYFAPAEYIPPPATMLIPLGEEKIFGSALEIVPAKKQFSITGKYLDIIALNGRAELSDEAVSMNWQIGLKTNYRLLFSFALVLPDSECRLLVDGRAVPDDGEYRTGKSFRFGSPEAGLVFTMPDNAGKVKMTRKDDQLQVKIEVSAAKTNLKMLFGRTTSFK